MTETASTTPARPRNRLAGLDGIRALAVGGVVLYHLGASWLRGGFLGVDLFFVLSGFLITTLLIEEHRSTGRVGLGAFWIRRARRLLPALFAMLAAVFLYVLIAGRAGNVTADSLDLQTLRGDGIATLLYVANWHLIVTAQNYFNQFSTPSPLIHTWSLAIEEQFYLIWPFAAIALFTMRRGRARRIAAVIVAIGALASAVEMTVLFNAGASIDRIYYGTDTRAFDLLVGVAAAFLTVRWEPSDRAARRMRVIGPLCVVVLLGFWVVAGTPQGVPRPFMFDGGFLLCALLAIGAIVSSSFQPTSILARSLSLRGLVVIGTVSYGIYLWHWPIIVFLNPQTAHMSGLWLDVVRIAVIALFTTLSYVLIEMPVRHGRLPRQAKLVLYPLATVAVVVVVFVGSAPALVAPPVSSGKSIHVAATLPGVGGISGQRPITLPAGSATAADPLRIGLFGDSMIYVASPGIEAALDSTGVLATSNFAFPGWGTTTINGWQGDLAQSIRANRSQLVVGTWSWDNGEALSDPAALKASMIQLVDVAKQAGAAGVILLGFPKVGPPASGMTAASQARTLAGERAWARVAASMPRTMPGSVMYLPINPSVELDGRFSAWLPKNGRRSAPLSDWVRVRRLDGTHLCDPGIVLYSTALSRDLTLAFHIPLASSSWPSGAWTDNSILTSSAQECPNDHPTSR